MKKYVIKKKGEDKWVWSWNPVGYTFNVCDSVNDAMPFSLYPEDVMKFYDKLNEFEIVEL